jgi:hypothetical protein
VTTCPGLGLMQIKAHARTCLSDATGQHHTPVGPDTASPATPNLQKGGAVFPALMQIKARSCPCLSDGVGDTP